MILYYAMATSQRQLHIMREDVNKFHIAGRTCS